MAQHERCGIPGCLPCLLAIAIEKANVDGGSLADVTFRCPQISPRLAEQRTNLDGWDGALVWTEGPTLEDVGREMLGLFGRGRLRIYSSSPVFETPRAGQIPGMRVQLDRRFRREIEAKAYVRAVMSELDAGRNALGIFETHCTERCSYSLYQALLEAHDRIELTPVEENLLAAVVALGFDTSDTPTSWHHRYWPVLGWLTAEAYRWANRPQPESARRLHERVTSVREGCDVCNSTDAAAMVLEVAEPFDRLPPDRPVRPVELQQGRILGAWCAAHHDGIPEPERLAEGWKLCRLRPDGVWVWKTEDSRRGRVYRGVRGFCDWNGCWRLADYARLGKWALTYLCNECAMVSDHIREFTWDETAQCWRDRYDLLWPWTPTRPRTRVGS